MWLYKNFQPSPGFSMNKEQVDKCIAKLDFEWNKEAKARAGGVYTGMHQDLKIY